MSKNANQKLKLLYLARILEEESDEGHPLTVSDLITALAHSGIPAERKSIYDDIDALSQFGYDIITARSRGNTYYLGERRFQAPELKLLVDAVQSAKFISESKSRALIKKICGLASRHEGGLMQRQVHVHGRAKTQSERTYYNVDSIQTAIADIKKTDQFKRFSYENKAADYDTLMAAVGIADKVRLKNIIRDGSKDRNSQLESDIEFAESILDADPETKKRFAEEVEKAGITIYDLDLRPMKGDSILILLNNLIVTYLEVRKLLRQHEAKKARPAT